MKFKEDCFYYKAFGSKHGTVYQWGKYASVNDAISAAKEHNAEGYEPEWQCLMITKLFHYKDGELSEVWSA